MFFILYTFAIEKNLKRTSNAMKNVLVIGSTGQIGSELTMKLRGIYGGNIVAGYIPGQEPKGELLESGPSAIVDITNEQQIAETVSKYKVDTIYNLAALLSAVAEANRSLPGKSVWAVCLTYWKLHVKCIVLYSLRVQSVCLAITRRKTRLRRIRSVTRVLCTVLRKFQASC